MTPYRPMLAYRANQPFDDPAWLFECKYDGFRGIIERHDGDTIIRYRSGVVTTKLYPELVSSAERLPANCVLDGEIVVFDDSGRTRLAYLQHRTRQVSFVCFDVLMTEREDVRSKTLDERKQILSRINFGGRILCAPAVLERGVALFRSISDAGLEGIVCKHRQSRYSGRRSHNWKKIKCSLS